MKLPFFVTHQNCRTLSIGLLIVILSACIRPYQPDLQQGNILNNSEIREIRHGMSKQEVLYILGTPLVADPFVQDRWDYYYSMKDGQTLQTQQRLITAIFEDGKLVSLSGDAELTKVQGLELSPEDKHTGGTVITKPTQKPKGVLTRMLNR